MAPVNSRPIPQGLRRYLFCSAGGSGAPIVSAAPPATPVRNVRSFPHSPPRSPNVVSSEFSDPLRSLRSEESPTSPNSPLDRFESPQISSEEPSLSPGSISRSKGKSNAVSNDECVIIHEIGQGSRSGDLGKGKAKLLSVKLEDEEDVVVLDPNSATVLESLRKRKRLYELRRKFQDGWAAQFPWAEPVKNEDGESYQVKCLVCSKVEGKDKLLVAKVDGLWKHAGRRKAEKDMVLGKKKIKRGEQYFLSDSGHVKNEKIYFATLGRDTVARQVAQSSTIERRRKVAQFQVLFHLISKGRPITDYEAIHSLLVQLRVPDLSRKHWSDNAGWEIVEAMAEVTLKKTQEKLKQARFISLSCDEVTSVDNACWLSCHVYVVENWKCIPILLCLTKVVDRTTSDNLTTTLVHALKTDGGLTEDSIAEKLVSFGADGASVFHGARSGVTTQLTKKYAPYVVGVHCMAHRTSLAVQALSGLGIVSKIEELVGELHAYFSHSSKRQAEFKVLADFLETAGNKILRNVKTRWISVKEPCERVMQEYKPLVAKMAADASTIPAAKSNLEKLLDLETFLALSAINPLLCHVNSLIKAAQARDIFVCDFVEALKMCEADILRDYVDPGTRFDPLYFQHFCDLVGDYTHTVSHQWMTDLNTGNQTLSFRIGDHPFAVHWINGDGKKEMVCSEDFPKVVEKVKAECTIAVERLIKELEKRFPATDIMSALGLVFPQYWLQPNCDEDFSLHLSILKTHFGLTRTVQCDDEIRQILEPVNSIALSQQATLFRQTMKKHADAAKTEPFDENPLTKVWSRLAASPTLREKLSEWFKVAEMAMVSVLGSVEDERTFSTMNWVKSKVRNRLGEHLDASVRMFSQPFWTLETFPYQDAITEWFNAKDQVGWRD